MPTPIVPSAANNFGTMSPAQTANAADVAALNKAPVKPVTPTITPDQYATAMHVALNTPPPAPGAQPDGQLNMSNGAVTQYPTAPMGTPPPVTTPAPSPVPISTGAISTPPIAPVVNPTAKLEEDYKANLVPTADENQISTDINNLEGASKLAVAGKEGQGRGIPVDLIRGQQALLEKQTQLQEQTLQQKLALSQAKRQTALEASKFALDRADKAADIARTQAKEDKSTQVTQEKFAKDNNITTPFYTLAGTVYRTSDNHAFSSPEEFFAAGGAKDFSNAPKIDSGSTGTAKTFETKQIGTTKNPQTVRYGYDAKGNIVSAVDLATGKSILSGGGSSGNTPVVPSITPTTPVPVVPKNTLTQEHSLIDQAFSQVTGSAKGENTDNYVSPTDWNKLADKFVKDKKGTYQDFYSKHKVFANPSHLQDYKGAK